MKCEGNRKYVLKRIVFHIRGYFERSVFEITRFNCIQNSYGISAFTVKILKFGTPQTIGIIVLKIEKFDVALH